MTITEFLEARIRGDEVSAPLREWHVDGCDSIPRGDYSFPCDCGLPERMAAECAAKRKIIENASDFYLLHILATVYASHADYRQEWVL